MLSYRYLIPLFLLLFSQYVYGGSACNGHESLCSQPFNNVTFLVTHDSYAHGPNLASTQIKSITQQLDDGVRGLKFSAVMHKQKVHLCHTTCTILDAGPATDILNHVSKWLESHQDQIITIMWNNLYDIDVAHLAEAYKASNIMPMVHVQEPGKPWPTLQEMVDSNKRVVNFVDSKADVSAAPWIHDQYTYVFETPYDNKDANGFTCVIDRPQSPPNPQDMMYVMNHFLYGVIHVGREIEVPQLDKASVTNGMDSLSKHVDDCHRAFGRKPNFVEVDFYDHGKALEFVAMLNNISLDESTDTKHPGFPWPSNLPHINEIRSRLLPLPSVPHIVIENGSCSRSSLHHISLLCTTLLSIIFISFF